MVPSVVREGSDQRGPEKVLRRSWKRSATDFAFCFSLQTFFFSRSSVIFFFPAGTCSSAPRTTGSVSLCRGRSRGPGLLTGHPQSMESQALWPGANDPPSRRSCAVTAGKRAGRGPQRAFRWGSSREQRPGPPSFTAGVLAARPSGCSAR